MWDPKLPPAVGFKRVDEASVSSLRVDYYGAVRLEDVKCKHVRRRALRNRDR
jgi:hypothetical protein